MFAKQKIASVMNIEDVTNDEPQTPTGEVISLQTLQFVYPFLLLKTESHDTLSSVSKKYSISEILLRELNSIDDQILSDTPLEKRTLVLRKDHCDIKHSLLPISQTDVQSYDFEKLAEMHSPYISLLSYSTSLGCLPGKFSIEADGISFAPADHQYRKFINLKGLFIRNNVFQKQNGVFFCKL